jgi:hypothetical protein
MFSVLLRGVFPPLLALALTLSPVLSYAAPSQDRVGVLMEFNWNAGDVHPDQSRWQANLALGSTSTIVRSMYATADINRKVDDVFEYDTSAGYYQERSLMPLQWSTDSTGNSLGRLYGLPVLSKLSPAFNASGSTGSGSTIVAKPWVWLGAIVVGVAASASGGGSTSASESSANDDGDGISRVEVVCGNNDIVLGDKSVAADL